MRVLPPDWTPVAVWTGAGLMPMVVAAAAGFDPLAADTWVRADSRQYLAISADGYDLYPCDPGSAVLCGDAGWFAAYPWVVWGLAQLGLDAPSAAVAVAWVFSLATLVLLWHTFLARLPVSARLAPVLLAAFVPGQIYHRAAFPLSMLAFFGLLYLWLLSRRRHVAAGVAGAIAAAAYPLGLLLLPVGAVFALVDRRVADHATRWRRAGLTTGLAMLGPLTVFMVMKLQTGSWTAYFDLHEKYGGAQVPSEPLHNAIELLFEGGLLDLDNVPPAQTLLVALGVPLLVAWCAVIRRRLTEVDRLILAVTVITWAFPLTQENLSLYRSEAALVPAAVLLHTVPRRAASVVTVIAVLLTIPMAVLFFENRLV